MGFLGKKLGKSKTWKLKSKCYAPDSWTSRGGGLIQDHSLQARNLNGKLSAFETHDMCLYFQENVERCARSWRFVSLQHLRVIWGQCCLRVAAGPCLPNGQITQLSPYFTRNPSMRERVCHIGPRDRTATAVFESPIQLGKWSHTISHYAETRTATYSNSTCRGKREEGSRRGMSEFVMWSRELSRYPLHWLRYHEERLRGTSTRWQVSQNKSHFNNGRLSTNGQFTKNRLAKFWLNNKSSHQKTN